MAVGAERERGGADVAEGEGGIRPGKKLRRGMARAAAEASVGPGDYSRIEGAGRGIAHGGPVVALSYTPDGRYLVSAGLDRAVRLWDLLPGLSSPGGRSGPPSAGVLLPTAFLGPSESDPRPLDRGIRAVGLAVVQPGRSRTATLWVGHTQGDLLGYDLHGPGGRPDLTLAGHLGAVASIVAQEAEMKVFTGGADGMILGWGARGPLSESKEEDLSPGGFFARRRRARRRSVSGRPVKDERDEDCWE